MTIFTSKLGRELAMRKAFLLMLTLTLGWALPATVSAQSVFEKMVALCDGGNSLACYKVGERYRTIELDNKKALVYFRKGCDRGHMIACNDAANLIQDKGQQYSKYWKEAAKLFDRACKEKYDKACFNLGALKYREGRTKQAIKWFKLSCDLGNMQGCVNVEKLEK